MKTVKNSEDNQHRRYIFNKDCYSNSYGNLKKENLYKNLLILDKNNYAWLHMKVILC